MTPLALLAGCTATAPSCQPMMEAALFFGLTDERAFNAFLDSDVTPRFPDGLTVLDAAGRWRAPDGRMTAERSKVVLIVAPPGYATDRRLDAIRNAYKVQFSQQSVGLVTQRACANF